jgi:hypothetical protein
MNFIFLLDAFSWKTVQPMIRLSVVNYPLSERKFAPASALLGLPAAAGERFRSG